MFSMILEDQFEELDEMELYSVNGGACSGGGCTGSSYSTGTCTSGGCTGTFYVSGSCTSGSCTGSTVTYGTQRYFSSKYGSEFGNNACAATSLLNEVSEQYTAETGRSLTNAQRDAAMQAAIAAGNISSTNATVNDWSGAANTMSKVLGLSGTYTYTSDSSKADATIYAWDKNGNGYVNHFVNDIGNGKYYDPWTGTTGNVSDLTLAKTGLGGTRYLDYSK